MRSERVGAAWREKTFLSLGGARRPPCLQVVSVWANILGGLFPLLSARLG